MSFEKIEGYRVDPYGADSVSRQIDRTFIVLKASMSLEEYSQYVEDLIDEATDYWYCKIDPHGYQLDNPATCTFGFISDIDATGFKLRWVE